MPDKIRYGSAVTTKEAAAAIVKRVREAIEAIWSSDDAVHVDPEHLLSVQPAADAYEACDLATREAVTAALTASDRSYLIAMTGILSEAAMQVGRPDMLRTALMVHAIEGCRLDPRENLRCLALTWYAAQRLKVDALQLFTDVAALALPSAAPYLLEFAHRPRESQALRVMHMEVIETDGKPEFHYVGDDPPEPRKRSKKRAR